LHSQSKRFRKKLTSKENPNPGPRTKPPLWRGGSGGVDSATPPPLTSNSLQAPLRSNFFRLDLQSMVLEYPLGGQDSPHPALKARGSSRSTPLTPPSRGGGKSVFITPLWGHRPCWSSPPPKKERLLFCSSRYINPRGKPAYLRSFLPMRNGADVALLMPR
jgi:hypothetical protein